LCFVCATDVGLTAGLMGLLSPVHRVLGGRHLHG
jgi:hypothetical protein